MFVVLLFLFQKKKKNNLGKAVYIITIIYTKIDIVCDKHTKCEINPVCKCKLVLCLVADVEYPNGQQVKYCAECSRSLQR